MRAAEIRPGLRVSFQVPHKNYHGHDYWAPAEVLRLTPQRVWIRVTAKGGGTHDVAVLPKWLIAERWPR